MASSAILLEDAMKITTHIDEELLKQAKRKTGIVSQREVIETGLRNLLADIQRKSFVKDFDKFRLDLTPKSLKESRG
jgi:Arc/MetJ family transcription regulator